MSDGSAVVELDREEGVNSARGVEERRLSMTATWARLPEWLQGVLGTVLIFLASRCAVLVTLSVGTFIVNPQATLRTELQMWDAGWYLRVATEGYPHEIPQGAGGVGQSQIAFFPLFPLVVRGVHWFTQLSFLSSAVIASVLCGMLAAVAVWLLVRRISGREAAFRSVILFSFFPASLALFAPFAEGLAIALSAACLLLLLERRWLWAGVTAGLATASRPTAVVLVGCCAWAAFDAIRSDRAWRSLSAVALAPAGILGYFLFLWHQTGSFSAWFRVEEQGWGQGANFGRDTVRAIQIVARGPADDVNALVCTAATVFAVAGLIAIVRWRPPVVVTLYGLGVCFLALTSAMASRPRYMLSAFPLVVAVGVLTRRPPLFAVLVGASGSLMGAYTLLSVLPAWAVF